MPKLILLKSTLAPYALEILLTESKFMAAKVIIRCDMRFNINFEILFNVFRIFILMNSNKPFITEDEKITLDLNKTYEERLRMLMRLIKLSRKMKAATIIYPKP